MRPSNFAIITSLCLVANAYAQTQVPPVQGVPGTPMEKSGQTAATPVQPPKATPATPGVAPVPGQPPTTQPGPVPPRDPRLVPPRVVDIGVPPPISIPAPPPGSLPPDIPIRPITANEAARIALRLQPNIGIAQASILVQRGITRQIRSGLMPQVTILGNYTYVQNLTHPGSSTGGVVPGGGSSGTGTGGGTGTSSGNNGGNTGTGTGNTGSGNAGSGNTGAGNTGTGTGSGNTGSGNTGSGNTGSGNTGSGNTGTGNTGTGTTTPGGGTTGSGTDNGTGSSGGTGSGGTGTTSPGTGGTGSGGLTNNGGASVTTSSGGSSVVAQGLLGEASLRQLIFDFNHTLDLVRQSVELERAATQNLTRVQNDTVLDVKLAFYTLVQNLQQVGVDEQDVANRQAQLDLARSRFNVGLGLPSDIVTAETAKGESVLILNQARANAEQARINLTILMGIDPRTPIVPAEAAEPDIPSNDVNGLTTQGLRQRPEVLQAQYNLRSAQYGVNAARTTNAPIVSGNVNVISRGDQVFPQQNDLTVGIGITWAPLDGGLTRGRVEQARGNQTIARQQLFIAEQTVRQDVASAYVNLRTAEQRVAASIANVNNAEEGVRIATGRYSAGLGLFLDIINAQAYLLTARTNLVTTQNAVQQYRVALQHAIGTPIPPVR